MKPTHRAIVFLQQARDIIDEEANNTSFDSTRRDDLNDIADELGVLLHHLESMDGAP